LKGQREELHGRQKGRRKMRHLLYNKKFAGGNKRRADLNWGASSCGVATSEDGVGGSSHTTSGTNFLLERSTANSNSGTSSLSEASWFSGSSAEFSSWFVKALSVAARSWWIAGLWGIHNSVSAEFASRDRVTG